MSAIKDLLKEEKDAEVLLKDAEHEAEAILRDARTKASGILKRAESEETKISELAAQSQERVAMAKSEILEGYRARAAEAEGLYKRNLKAAVNFVMASVLGVDYEW